MKKRTLVIGDIHGGLKALHQVLERAAVTPEDQLIFLGDYVDGWSESPEVIDYLIHLKNTHACIFIRGNHDVLCYQWLKFNKDNPEWVLHGGKTTLEAYSKCSITEKLAHIKFFESLNNYYLDDANNLYLHAGFTNQHGVTREYFPEMFYWDRSLWETALSLDPALSKNSNRYPKRLLHYNEIYIGHTPTIRIGEIIPVNAANVWNIDTGAAFKGPLTIIDVTTKQFWQSDNVNELYPNEIGRN